VVARGRTSSIVHLGENVASGRIAVNCEGNGKKASFGSPKLLSDVKRLTSGANAMALEVDVADGISCSSPSTSNGSAVIGGIRGLDASKVGDIFGRISLGIGDIGGELDDGRVGRPNSDVGINSGNPDVVSGGCG